MKLILIKSGYRNKTTAALFAINWQLRNNRPIVFKKEGFVLFNLYSVYYVVCENDNEKPIKTGG